MIDATERFTAIHEAVEMRNNFLKEHPELTPFQEEVERRLRNAGSNENRMVILRSIMNENLFKLSQACSLLNKPLKGR